LQLISPIENESKYGRFPQQNLRAANRLQKGPKKSLRAIFRGSPARVGRTDAAHKKDAQ